MLSTTTSLTAGHPVYDAWIGQPDPAANNSQNPVGYVELPEEAEYRNRLCACGCGESSTRDFLPGHDLRAIQDRVRRSANGSVLTFINWIDDTARDAFTGVRLRSNPWKPQRHPGAEQPASHLNRRPSRSKLPTAYP